MNRSVPLVPLFALLGLAGCTRGGPTAPAPSAERASFVVDRDAFCRGAADENERAIAPFVMGDVPWFGAARGHCYRDARGAWALRVRTTAPADASAEEAPRAILEIVRAQESGTAAMTLDGVAIREYETYACRAVPYDFDRDGAAELFVACDLTGASDFRTTRVRALLTSAGGAVGPFPPARGFDLEEMRDFDGDGVPELAYVYFRAPELNCDQRSPLYLARWTPPGGFSADASGWDRLLRRECPSPPSLEKPEGDPWTWIACNRLWGIDASVVRNRMASSCASSGAPSGEACHHPCDFPASWATWLSPPPRTLP